MKTKNILLIPVILFCASASWTQAASISQTIASINADAQKPGGPERALKSISAATNIPVATLAKEKASTGLSYGDLYVGHAIASASGKKFDQIVALKTQGQSWDKIADANNVSLGGKKTKKTAADMKPASRTNAPNQSPDSSNMYKNGAMH
jgi:hypothetical protein